MIFGFYCYYYNKRSYENDIYRFSTFKTYKTSWRKFFLFPEKNNKVVEKEFNKSMNCIDI